MAIELVELIGASDGASKPFEQWRLEALQAGLQPGKIQNLKRGGYLHTRINPDGTHVIVRGKDPNKSA